MFDPFQVPAKCSSSPIRAVFLRSHGCVRIAGEIAKALYFSRPALRKVDLRAIFLLFGSRRWILYARCDCDVVGSKS